MVFSCLFLLLFQFNELLILKIQFFFIIQDSNFKDWETLIYHLQGTQTKP
jgi:hypothetical protein